MAVYTWIKRHYTAVIIVVALLILTVMAIINRSTTLHDSVQTRLLHLRTNLSTLSSIYTRSGAEPIPIPPESDSLPTQLRDLFATIEQSNRPINSPSLIDQYDFSHAHEQVLSEHRRLGLSIHQYNRFVTFVAWSWLLKLVGVSPLPTSPN